MGYSYGQNQRGNWVLACDNCSEVGGVRKRTCHEKVTTEHGHVINYCYPAALCSDCYAKLKSTLHAGCKDGAREAQKQYDAIRAVLETGAPIWSASYGDWHEDVHEGMVGMFFKALDGSETFLVVDRSDYEAAQARKPLPTTPADCPTGHTHNKALASI